MRSAELTSTRAPAAMRGLIRRAAVATGAAVALLLSAAGPASAGRTPVLSWTPATSAGTYNYGTLGAGQTASQAFTLTNSGGTGTSALKVTLTGSPAFTDTADTCSATSLGPGKSCSVTVTFTPAASGRNDAATLTATSNKAAAIASLTLLGAAKGTPTITTSPSPGGPAGTTVTDTATLSGGSSPTGTITFVLSGPSATADCSKVGAVVVLNVNGNGTYATATVLALAPDQAGTYWWTATYSGDASNNPAATACGDESVVIGPASPAITTSPSPGGPAGTTVTDTATLSGGSFPTGTITFALSGPSATADCSTAIETVILNVNGNGTYTMPAVLGASPAQAGTYWWTARYSGDASNYPAATACGDESVVISP